MTIKDIKLDGSQLPIREFKMKTMVPNPSICMIAKRGSGKSWVVRDILTHFKDLPGGVIIAPTDRMSTFYGKFFPDIYIHYEYTSSIVEKILYRQDRMMDKCRQKAKNGRKVDPRAFLVMDDCLSTKGSWAKDEQIMKLFFDGRHYKLMYILTMQFPLGLKPELRTNFDYVFMLAEDFVSNQKRLYEHYAGMFPSFDSFRQVFIQVTKDYGAMVIVNRGARASFLDKVYWYKADNVEVNQIGSDQFNKFHKQNYDPEWNRKHIEFDINEYVTNKKKSKLDIKIEKV